MTKKTSMIVISDDPQSQKAGSRQILDYLQNKLGDRGLSETTNVTTVVDLQPCEALPLAIIYPEAIVYGPLTINDIDQIIEDHRLAGQEVKRLIPTREALADQLSWLSARKGTNPTEKRIVLERAGKIDPEKIEDYLEFAGYKALKTALKEMSPEEVINVISASGLQGRGGAGFPVGRKWSFVAGAPGIKKYVICNADESEPGTYKDRLIMENDPHAIVEAMLLAGYAVGASEGYIYIRGEYPLAQKRILKAIRQAEEHGFMGEDILGSGFDFQLHMHSGAGAYICGEETALIESIEGKRGEPRSRPPYPPTYGLWGMPTLINNVETLANIPPILRNGSDWYRSFGTPSSPGTKVFTFFGNVNQTGAIEVPMGITLREVIHYYAKGIKDGGTLKLAQTGGSSGSIVPASLQDAPMDFESARKFGVSLGSGALLITDQQTCVVDLVRTLLQFFRFESCGKCTPCRIGTEHNYQVLDEITHGMGQLSQLDDLQRYADEMERLSNCGLGQTAGVPVRDMLKHFRTEVEAHIKLGICPTGVCPMIPEEEPQIVQYA